MAVTEEPRRQVDMSRRAFLRTLTGRSGGAPILDQLDNDPESVLTVYEEQIETLSRSPSRTMVGREELDSLERMRRDLVRALARPREDRHWVMVIDLRKCVGCHACTIACVAENKLPPGVVYRPVLEEEIGTYPHVTRRFTPRPCMQCDEPPCVPVCPVSATYKNKDGVVVIDYDQCIGCRYCVTACPYAARTFDFGETYTEGTPEARGLILGEGVADDYERAANFEYSEARERTETEQSPIGNVRKCHFCLHRIAVGMLPACVTTCIGRATMFGDAHDQESLVSEMMARPNVMRLKEDLGTKPRVFYLT